MVTFCGIWVDGVFVLGQWQCWLGMERRVMVENFILSMCACDLPSFGSIRNLVS